MLCYPKHIFHKIKECGLQLMGTDGWLLTIIYILLVVLSAYFSAVESAFAGMNRIRIKNLAENGDRRSKSALYISEHFDRTLSTILICNNLCNIGGASIATVISFKVFAILKESANVSLSEAAETAIATAVTTIIVCIAGEILPKNYANVNSDKVVLATAPSLRFVMVITFPVAIIFVGITRLLTSFFKTEEEPTVTEEELSTIIENVEDEGIIDEEQSDLLQSALEFSETNVADVLTVRDDIVSVDVSMSNEEILNIISNNKYSRMPVTDGDLDNIVGILIVKKFLRKYISKENFSVRDIMAEPYFVPLEAIIDDELKKMSHEKNYMAVAKDKSGKTLGIITIEDFLEELVGEIWDEDDVVNDNFIKLGGNRFKVSGSFSFAEMIKNIGYEIDVSHYENKSVQSWVLEILAHMPEEEEEFEWNDLTVTILELDENRIKKIEVKLNTPELDVSSDEDGEKAEEETEGKEQKEAASI
ncbi:MAG: HlyC/CorC family transporter [Ruminococcaceae bacterium]|nr:HlyC/CorC family transporter [Oscillospiraceae bacterium]